MKNWIKVTLDIDPVDHYVVEQKIALWPDITGIMETEPKPSLIRLEVYSAQANRDKITLFAEELKKIAKSITIEAMIYDPADEVEWKKYFKPQKIGSHFVIRPSWEAYEAKAGELVITIDPGAAFGTGLHETTRGVLILLEEISKELGGSIKEAEVLDAGTGSGVLGIGALMLGAKKLKAIDNDPEAVSIAKDNIKINHEGGKARTEHLGVEKEKGHYDIVMANIISEVLIQHKDHITGLLKKRAHLVLSGILTVQEESVIKAYTENSTLKVRKSLKLGEWSSIWLSDH